VDSFSSWYVDGVILDRKSTSLKSHHRKINMKTTRLAVLGLVLAIAGAHGQDRPSHERIEAALKQLSPHVAAESDLEQLRTMLGRRLRGQIEAANKASSAAWRKIESRDDWEIFRREKLVALRKSLGELPSRPAAQRTLVTGRHSGDGFEIRNMVYESRPGLVVTANLYVPQPQRPSMPGLILSHSHHNPKEQGELQDMGMTWARAGCYVLVPDHLGHGDRRQHPFVSAADYSAPFQVGRQDYYFRYDTSLQLYLVGDTLMGWMVHDLMTGVDVLLAQPGIDSKRVAILGSVAGGGDPAAVAAALDERIACAVPFNFGGPQPETRYPLPDDAETSFNYAGGGSWESTRDLYRSAADLFLPWVIVGSIAPRHLIHAHEFAWDGARDPVWKRYNRIWSFFDAADQLSVAHGHGTLTGQDPPGSHCNNIGAVHRRQIHEAFRRWMNVVVRPEDEYSQRLAAGELTCLTDEARQQLRPRLLHDILAACADKQLAVARESRTTRTAEQRRQLVRESWSRLLGDVEPIKKIAVHEGSPHIEEIGGLRLRREILETEPGILVPVMTMELSAARDVKAPRPVMLTVADDGIAGILQRRATTISEKLKGGSMIVVAEVRGTGVSGPGSDRGPQSKLTSQSATCLMLGQPLIAGQLRDLRAVWQHVQRETGGSGHELTVVGDSGARPLATEARFVHPHRVERRPAESQPNGALLALLFALFEDDVNSVEAINGLVSLRSALESPFVQVPHYCVIPGVLREGDVADLVVALAPRKVRLRQLVDACSRLVRSEAVRAAFETAIRTYEEAGVAERLEFASEADRN
jgi:dienelactone hydrolase